MANKNEYTITTEETGKILSITLEGCSMMSSTLHIHPPCACGGSGIKHDNDDDGGNSSLCL